MRAAAILVLVGAACEPRHVVLAPSPSQDTADRTLLYRLDHVLTTYRVPMCHEFDRELPNLAPPPRRSVEAMTAACEGGDGASCDEVGTFWEKADNRDRSDDLRDRGRTSYAPRPDLEHFYGRGCDLGSDHACRALRSVLYREHKHQALLALAFALFHAGRTELSAEAWFELRSPEREVFAPTLPALRTKLETACASGSAKACETRAELEEDRDASWSAGPFDPKKRPWFVKACLAGSVNACGWALAGTTSIFDHLDRDAVERTEEIVARVCDGPTCNGLVAALGESCRGGVWSSCYLAANACTRGGIVPAPPKQTPPAVIFTSTDSPTTSVN